MSDLLSTNASTGLLEMVKSNSNDGCNISKMLGVN